MDAGQIATWGLAFRIGERVVLSVVVILVAFVVTVGFWRTIQRVNFQLSRDKMSGAANVVLATPVFALLALIGFAWVSFSHPVSISIPVAGGQALASDGGLLGWIGAVPGAPAPASDLDIERQNVEAQIMSLNCVARAAGPVVTSRSGEADALAAARLNALRPVWADDWGDFAAFQRWAFRQSEAAPDPEAAAVYSAAHEGC